ncbi:hypothetical protein SCP_0204990 [Sparassis crispa]|uniref:DUF6593 domain-containing protein n=1 Tax=Sparassis crispa TaxID=139825 RepID=A0A401GAY1_9APHY|nr:hypothetical protein SCP_0204990 [Sparassis crispa]GBE79301.1 hypothetical protein SCP_0204990 [Sparassis crispa]
MANTDVILQFLYPSDDNHDMRTFQAKQMVEGSTEMVEMYKFHHPATGSTSGVTSFQRKNLNTQRWENAGQIEWMSDSSATVYFGIERVSARELRRSKKTSSKSRRFKVAGSEYKWKIAENGVDLFCVSTRGKTVAVWSQETQVLRVTERAEGFLDRVVVTCLLNLWMKNLNICE